MINEITTELQYIEVVASIENVLLEATEKGGFDFLSELEKEKLACLSLLTEQYEDDVLKLMPLFAY